MKLDTRRRWLLLGGLLTATLAAAAWVRDNGAPQSTELVDASKAVASAAPKAAKPPRSGAAGKEAPQVNLEKLKSRDLEAASRDPFATAAPRAAKPKRAAAAAAAAAAAMQAAAAPPPPPTAPPLPFTYMGRMTSDEDLAVFLSQGSRNLVVHEGDTIDSLYRVDQIAESAITLTYLPLNQRQTIVIGERR
ncbi:MAG TPA: hypothetical protein VFB20_07105 [Burkholderiales bacterium]|nr:hypothetical protein [Burkholderiales bacterium]